MFLLAYGVPGFVYPVSEMTPEDREEYLKMLRDQKERETAAVKKAGKRRA